jgi:hypothetical protein
MFLALLSAFTAFTVSAYVLQVKRYHAVDHIPPKEASDASTSDRIRGARCAYQLADQIVAQMLACLD